MTFGTCREPLENQDWSCRFVCLAPGARRATSRSQTAPRRPIGGRGSARGAHRSCGRREATRGREARSPGLPAQPRHAADRGSLRREMRHGPSTSRSARVVSPAPTRHPGSQPGREESWIRGRAIVSMSSSRFATVGSFKGDDNAARAIRSKTRALTLRVPLGSITTRAGSGPVTDGDRADHRRAPCRRSTMTASTSDRRRCK